MSAAEASTTGGFYGMALLTLLTDFGSRDFFVAAVKGVLASQAPGVPILDLGHDIPAGAVTEAAFFLGAALPCFPDGAVHLAVVDPGVGSSRRLLAVAWRGSHLVGPDNGLFEPFLDSAAAVHAVDRPDLYRPSSGGTFHGRDRFAPIAAWLARGGALAELGPAIPDPVRLALEPLRREPGRIAGRVAHIDRFGNLLTDIPAAWLEGRSARFRLPLVARSIDHRAGCYTEIPPGTAAWLVGSLGTVELAMDRASLAERWGLEIGCAVVAELGDEL
jgi:S-adenosyl-L-methionine hydrolase (adenosine-forming)